MSTSEDRHTVRASKQPGQNLADRQARQRRAPLFPLADEDLEPPAQRRPPSPLGDLVADIDQALPTKAIRQQPVHERSQLLTEEPGPTSQHRRSNAGPTREASPVRSGATRERATTLGQGLRRSGSEAVQAEVGPMQQARARFEETAASLAHLEHVATRGSFGSGGYLPPAGLARGLSHWVWVSSVALISVAILVTLGGGGVVGFSDWRGLLPGTSAPEQRATLFVGQARPVGDYTLKAPPSISPETIDNILASYGSPATGSGEIWYNLGLQYGIDPAFAVAFFIHESAAGTAQGWAGHKPDGSTTHNVGNIICAGYGTCYGRFRDYPSWSEGIEDWYRLIDVEYLQGRGHQTVADIIPVYAPSVENDVQGYISVVERMIDQWRSQGAP